MSRAVVTTYETEGDLQVLHARRVAGGDIVVEFDVVEIDRRNGIPESSRRATYSTESLSKELRDELRKMFDALEARLREVHYSDAPGVPEVTRPVIEPVVVGPTPVGIR